MTPEQALLAAIWANPHDDAVRLVYADWLEEHDDDRHRFVRGHAELRRLGPDHVLRPDAEAELSRLRRGQDGMWLKSIEPERAHLLEPTGEHVTVLQRSGYRAVCDCFDPGYDAAKKWKRLELHAESQDTECEAWKRLCDLVELAARDGRTEFSPLSELALDQRRFIVTLPPSIAQLKAVRVLNLYGSSLVRIPPEIREMESLVEFDPYTSYRLHWYPFEITHCPNLRDSRMSTRALYGNKKYDAPFASLVAPDLGLSSTLTSLAKPPIRPCSVCSQPFEDRQRHRVWITLRVATDDMPLLVNACSRECVEKLPPPKHGYCPYPHFGGLGSPRKYR